MGGQFQKNIDAARRKAICALVEPTLEDSLGGRAGFDML
jgi:hypothetical protein